MKRIVACNNLLNYPGFNEELKICTNYSKFQLGEVNIQKDKPTAFYSRKLTDTPKRYTATERGLLNIAETQK